MKLKATSSAIALGIAALALSSNALAIRVTKLDGTYRSVVNAEQAYGSSSGAASGKQGRLNLGQPLILPQGNGSQGQAIATTRTAKAASNRPSLDLASLRKCGSHCRDLPSLPPGLPIVSLPPVATGLPSFSVSPVPEPESYLMMLAGLGLVGYMARRRARSIA